MTSPIDTGCSNMEYVSRHISLGIRRSDGVDVPRQILSIQIHCPDTTQIWSPHVVMLAFSYPTWSMANPASLKQVISKLLHNPVMKGVASPTRFHTNRSGWDIWSEPRSVWILVGEDGLYQLITHQDEGNHVDWRLFPSVSPGVSPGSHRALSLVLGPTVSNRLAADSQRKLALNYPDI